MSTVSNKEQSNVFLEGPTATAQRVMQRLSHLVGNKSAVESFLCEHYGLEHLNMDDPNIRIPCRIIADLLDRFSQMTSNPVFGLSILNDSQAYSFRGHYMNVTKEVAENVREFVDISSRYNLLETENIKLVQEVRGESLVCRFILVDPEYTNYHQTDFGLLASKQLIKRQYQLLPTKVTLMQACPKGMKSLYEERFECPVYFEAGDCQIFYPLWPCVERRESKLSLESLHATESQLSKYYVNQKSDVAAGNSVVNQVDFWVGRLLIRGEPTRQQVAKLMGMSIRTLQRKLALEQATFKSVLNQCRKRIAIQYLDHSSLSVVDIAWLLGYSESSQFYQSFRRWTGISLSGYRHRHC